MVIMRTRGGLDWQPQPQSQGNQFIGAFMYEQPVVNNEK